MRYLLVLWLLVLSTIAFLDRTNISIAGVQIAREFRIDNSHLGWVFSGFLIGYAGFQIPGGVLVRQSIWIGLFVVMCAWLQMPRVLNLPVAFFLGLVFIVIEVFLRSREIRNERAEYSSRPNFP